MPLIPLTVDRLLMVLLVAQYVVWRRFGWTLRKPLTTADYLVMAFLLVLTVSTLTHDWQAKHWQSLSCLLFFNVMPMSLYWIARQAMRRQRGAYALFAGFAAFGLYLAFTAVCETRGLTAFVVPSYIASPKFPCSWDGPRTVLEPGRKRNGDGDLPGGGLHVVATPGRIGRLAIVCFDLAMLSGVYSTYTRCAWMGGLCA